MWTYFFANLDALFVDTDLIFANVDNDLTTLLTFEETK